MITIHSEHAREILRRAGMSMNTELDVDGAARLQQAVEEDWTDRDRIFRYVMGHHLREETTFDGQPITNEQGENTMAKTKSAGRPAKAAPTKALVNQIAKERREGSTWDQIIASTGYRTNSTGFRILLEENGFDKFGRKGGRGESAAKGWGSADLNGKSKAKAAKPKAKKRVKRTKATAKK